MSEKKKEKKRKKGGGHTLYAITVLFLAFAIVVMATLLLFHVQTIEICDNQYVESSVVAESIQSDKYASNTLYIMMKNALGKIQYPQSIEKVKIRMKTPWSIRVIVTEKEPIGCTVIKDEYVLFDKNGIVLGKTPIQPEGILYVEGIQSNKVKVNEELPVKEKRIFRNIIDSSEAFAQYKIVPTRTLCDGANLTVYIGDICVILGSGDMELKINQLPGILSKLEGKKGTLDLQHYNESTEIISFKEGEFPKGQGE